MKSLLTALIASLLLSLSARAALPLAVEDQPLPSLAPMIERVQASIVRVAVQTRVQKRRGPFDDPFFRRFLDQGRSQSREIYSTGVVIDAEQGLILANEHSVRGSEKTQVTLSDGRQVDGDVIGSDVASDVALIKVSAPGLTAIQLGNSADMRIGDFVVSIGDPLGEQNTIVTGVISALAKPNSLRTYQNFLQSDAAVGPGVLVDLNGYLVGLNIAKSAQTASNSRIGFSTPVDRALRVTDQLAKYGTPQRGFLAVQVQNLTPELSRAFSISQRGGAVVTSVDPDSSAERAGLMVGDVILEAASQKISRSNDLRAIIGQQFAGETLDLTVMRQGASLQLQPLLESSASVTKKGNLIHYHLEGATFDNIDTRRVSTNVEEGVLVSGVKQGSVAWNHGVRANDIIVAANRKSVRDLASFRQAIDGKDVLMLNVVRGNGALFLLLQ